MKQKIKNKLNMYKAVQSVCMGNPTAWADLQPFDDALTLFSAKIAALEQATYRQGIATLGVKIGKEQLRTNTMALAEVISSGLRAYASATSNAVLAEQVRVTKRDFQRGGSQALLNLVDRIVELANAYVVEIGPFGISFQQIDDLALLRQQLGLEVGKPRAAIIDRHQQTLAIEELEGELDDLLKNQLDCLMEVLKPGNGKFWQVYRSARVIVDLKATHGDKGAEEPDGA